MRKILFFVILVFPFVVFAQTKPLSAKQQKKKERKDKIDEIKKKEEEGALVFNKQSVLGIKANTDGYGLYYEHGKFKTVKKTSIWWLEIGEHKHNKEVKTQAGILSSSTGFTVGSPYIYGKVNNFYNFKVGFGEQRMIGGKSQRNGVAVLFNYGGGLSLALLKPYYLDVKRSPSIPVEQIKFQQDSTTFLDQNLIIGSSGISKGFGEIKVVPGIHTRASLRFDYGLFNEFVSALEIGVNAEYYFREIQQMAFNKNKTFFLNAYLAICFGQRK